MKQVIICTDGIFPHSVGGMQRHSALLINALSSHKEWQIIVVHPHDEKLFAEYSNIIEHQITPIDEQKNYLRECYDYSKRVYRIIEKYPKAVIYSQGLSVWHKAKKIKNRLIVNPHGLEPFQAIGRKDKLVSIPFKMVFKSIFKRSSYVVSLGGKLTDILNRIVGKNQVVVLPNGVLPRENFTKTFRQNKRELLFVARFAHNKGIHLLMDAVKYLNDNNFADRFTLHLVGKGPLYNHYTENYKFSNVIYHGFVDDDELENLYRGCDGFVFPTLFEGMPTVVLEAMACQMPVICSNTGAVAELVDKNTGWLIEPNNINQLIESMRQLIESSQENLMSMAHFAHKKIENQFTWKSVAERHIQLFDQILLKHQ